jgi:hypothetical protein
MAERETALQRARRSRRVAARPRRMLVGKQARRKEEALVVVLQVVSAAPIRFVMV